MRGRKLTPQGFLVSFADNGTAETMGFGDRVEETMGFGDRVEVASGYWWLCGKLAGLKRGRWCAC